MLAQTSTFTGVRVAAPKARVASARVAVAPVASLQKVRAACRSPHHKRNEPHARARSAWRSTGSLWGRCSARGCVDRPGAQREQGAFLPTCWVQSAGSRRHRLLAWGAIRCVGASPGALASKRCPAGREPWLCREPRLTHFPARHAQNALGVALAGAASLVLTFSANAATVKLGGDGGELAFTPSSVTIAKGESVTWCAHPTAHPHARTQRGARTKHGALGRVRQPRRAAAAVHPASRPPPSPST